MMNERSRQPFTTVREARGRKCPKVLRNCTQEPSKGGFRKGGFCRARCHGQGNKNYPRILGPAVHLALRAPQPREAYILAKKLSKSSLFLVPDARWEPRNNTAGSTFRALHKQGGQGKAPLEHSLGHFVGPLPLGTPVNGQRDRTKNGCGAC